MTNCRIIYNNRWRKGNIYAYSSQHPQFPVEDTQGDTLSQFMRTRYGTGSGNGRFAITDANKWLSFDEGGAELTAIVIPGVYNGNTLATAIAYAMNNAPGKTLTYSCVYDEPTASFDIYAGANFTIRWKTGTHAVEDFSDVCGYSDAADDTGAASYWSDYRRIHHPYEYASNDLLSAVEVNFIAILNHNIQAAATIYVYGADDSGFTSGVITETINPVNSGSHFFFFSQNRTKRYWQMAILDPTNPNSYIQVGPILLGKYWQPNYNFTKDYTKGKDDQSIIEESHARVSYAQPRPRRKVWNLPFESGLTDNDSEEIILFHEEAGLDNGFIVCFDYNYPNTNSYFVQNQELIRAEYKFPDNWRWGLEIIEKL